MNSLHFFLATLCCLVVVAGSATGQTAQPNITSPTQSNASSAARSHVERFRSPEAQAERLLADASAKVAKNPNDTEALNARALARMRLGQLREAHEDLQRAIALRPANADYIANLGYVLGRLGRATEAATAARRAINLDDKNFTAHHQLGRMLLLGGDSRQLAESVTHLRRALELDPRRSEIRFDLLTAYRALGDASQALAQLQLLQDARPSDPRVTYAEALLASDRGDIEAAIRGFHEVLRLDSTLHATRQDLGLAYVRLNRWTEAVETFAELARRQSDSIEAAYFYALALFNSKQVNEAEREARRALRLDAASAPAQTLLGIILAAKGGRDAAAAEAVEALTQAVALDPASFDAQFYLGRAYYAARDYTAAAKALRSAVTLNPRHAEARFFLGTVLEAAGEAENALNEYAELVKLAPDSAIGQMGFGALLLKQNRTDDAIAALRRATALDLQSFEAHLSLGRALVLAARPSEAVDALRQAIALEPERPDAHYQLGLALRRLGQTDEAAREFAIVERINREFRSRQVNAKQ